MVEPILFVLMSLGALAGAVTVVAARNPVYSAMGLLGTLFSVAVLYVLQLAHLVAAVQVIVYAGAVLTLFLFVIMLIGVDKAEDTTERLPFQRPLALLLSGGLLVLIIVAGRAAWVTGFGIFSGGEVNGTIENVADELFGTWLIPFQATVLLLTIAAVGTIALAQFSPRVREAAAEVVQAEADSP